MSGFIRVQRPLLVIYNFNNVSFMFFTVTNRPKNCMYTLVRCLYDTGTVKLECGLQ